MTEHRWLRQTDYSLRRAGRIVARASRVSRALRVVARVTLWATLLCALSAAAHAQAPAFLVKEINAQPIPISSNPRGFVAVGSTVMFVADTPSGFAVWKSDGTESGTIRLSAGFADIGPLTVVNDCVFFIAADGKGGATLWKSDGTPVGTAPITAVHGVDLYDPYRFVALNGALVFITGDWQAGFELWRSDGTNPGTVPLAHLDSYAGMKALDDRLFFTAGDTTTGIELWVSDGTPEGTMLVKDINPGAGSSTPMLLGAIGDAVIFAASSGGDIGTRIWRTDGTAAGTVAISDPPWTSSIESSGGQWGGSLAAGTGPLFFTVIPDYASGTELWKTDGTAAGTVLVKQIAAYGLTEVGGSVFFIADDGMVGRELWKSDGTPAGTVLVKDVNPGPGGSFLVSLIGADGRLFFMTKSGSTGVELWTSDGTTDGTQRLVPQLSWETPFDPHFTDVDGTLFFQLSWQLWKTDGTPAGTVPVMANASAGAWLSPFASTNGELVFAASDAQSGVELWKTDGTPEGTAQIANLAPEISTSTGGSYPYSFTDRNGTVFFLADDGVHGTELWRSDGTHTGTAMVRDINPGAPSAFPRGDQYPAALLTLINGTLFFAADDGESGWELWKSDGTEHGTQRLRDLIPGPVGSLPYGLTDVDGTLFFFAGTSVGGTELWKSDGTADGTARVATPDPAPGGYQLHALAVVGGTPFFLSGTALWTYDRSTSAATRVTDLGAGIDRSIGPVAVRGRVFILTLGSRRDTRHNRLDVWTSDGTAAGTVLVTSIAGVQGADHLVAVGDDVFFVTYGDGAGGYVSVELWRSDGTESGTLPLAPILVDWSSPLLSPFDGALFFSTSDAATGVGLFRTDGTVTGTTLLKTVVARSVLTDVGGRFLLQACTPTGDDCGVWESDGTTAGTRPLAAGFASRQSPPPALTAAGAYAFFSAADRVTYDEELWAVPLASLGQCGNGMLDPGETCDDGGESEHCDADCTAPACGDATVNRADGEDCDEGNLGSGGCCTVTCVAEPIGTSCYDLDLCNGNEACDAGGVCRNYGPPLQCDDDNPNTIDHCDALNGCTHIGIATCRGDCDGDDSVTIDELTALVNIALGRGHEADCAAGDANRDGRTSVDELIAAVRSVLGGCPLLDDL